MSQRSGHQKFVVVGEKYTQSNYTDIKAMYHQDGKDITMSYNYFLKFSSLFLLRDKFSRKVRNFS